MKLLFDQNLSYKLCDRFADVFPGSEQVRRLGLDVADDRTIWQYAMTNGFAIVSHDVDFADLAAVLGSPPKIVWLRCGNQPTESIERLLRDHAAAIIAFSSDPDTDCIELLKS
jgi:predicted nuclease of predicted toxin-antitoxin system